MSRMSRNSASALYDPILNGMDIIRSDFMEKKALVRKRFTSDNYKFRWFVLTSEELRYYDGTQATGYQKMKGSIKLSTVQAVEKVSDQLSHNAIHMFQVAFMDQDENVYILYVRAPSDEKRDEWIRVLRRECEAANAKFSPIYHPGMWIRKFGQFQCCKQISRFSPGCKPSFIEMGLPTGGMSNMNQSLNNNAADTQAADDPQLVVESPPSPTQPRYLHNEVMDRRGPGTGDSRVLFRVQARFDYTPQLDDDLELNRGEEYDILDDKGVKFWWRARDRHGKVGYIPENYVDRITEHGLEKYAWYYRDIDRPAAHKLLMNEKRDGCYLIRNASSPGTFSLSVYFHEGTKETVKHYHIKKNSDGKYFFSERHAFETIPELVEYHSYNAGGIITRLKSAPNQQFGIGLDLSDKWEIDVEQLKIQEMLGKGEFGTVHAAMWNGIKVAVKMLKPGTMTEDKFIEEAETMTKIRAPHLVELYGLCVTRRPIYIVTEYMRHGSLQTYLVKNKMVLKQRRTFLLDVCLQVCKGMSYLESHGFIHRDLAARNCLVGEQFVVKVADFGLARFVLDDEYTSSNGAKFPIRWASPEVLNFCRFSSKSDVWAFGILMWEVFSFGKLPYEQLNNTQVCEVLIEQKHRLSKPVYCDDRVYQTMYSCWAEEPDARPMFYDLEREIESVKHPEISI